MRNSKGEKSGDSEEGSGSSGGSGQQQGQAQQQEAYNRRAKTKTTAGKL